MHLVYLDEVKYEKGVQPHHRPGALAISEADLSSVELRFAKIAEEFFGSSILESSREFHACDIVHGRRCCKGRSLNERVAAYKQLVDVEFPKKS